MVRHPTFNWEAEDKYKEIKNFILKVNNIFELYSMPQPEQIANHKQLAKKKRPMIPRIINTDGTRKISHNRRFFYIIKQ